MSRSEPTCAAPRSSDTYAGVSPTWTPPMNNWPTFSSRSRRASVWSGQSAGTSGLADGEDGDAPGVCGVVFGSDGDGEAVSDAAGRDSVSLGAAEGSSPPHAARADVIRSEERRVGKEGRSRVWRAP